MKFYILVVSGLSDLNLKVPEYARDVINNVRYKARPGQCARPEGELIRRSGSKDIFSGLTDGGRLRRLIVPLPLKGEVIVPLGLESLRYGRQRLLDVRCSEIQVREGRLKRHSRPGEAPSRGVPE